MFFGRQAAEGRWVFAKRVFGLSHLRAVGLPMLLLRVLTRRLLMLGGYGATLG